MATCAVMDRRGASIAQGIVVIVHGLYGAALPMAALRTSVRFRNTYDALDFRYTPRQQNLRLSGMQLSEFLHQRKPHTIDDSVHFVTFGYGALVLREAFRYIDWNYTRSKVVMVAPPNRGVMYYRSMKKRIGVAGYGGVAAEELCTWTAEDLDRRLGKLPRRTSPLVLAGSLGLNPFNQGNYPNDGVLALEETALPGQFRQHVIAATHYTLPFHPTTLLLTNSFLGA